MYRSIPQSPSNLRVFNACLLSFMILIAPIASVAAATLRATTPSSAASRTTKKQPATLEELESALFEPKAASAAMPVTAPMPAVGPITATKVDSFPDADGDGKADLGETITYTVGINNPGSNDALNMVFNDTIDANTTFVPGSMHASPIAFNDTYNWVGNTVLDTSARLLPSVTANDFAPTDSFTVDTQTNLPTTQGGLVTLASNGHFVYTPQAGDGGPGFSDTFTYTIRNSADSSLAGTGTVTINMPTRVWYLQGGASGDGRSNTPSNNPATMSTNADQATDVFYVFSSGTTLNGAFTLDASQQLLGQGVALNLAGFGVLFAAGSAPTIGNTSGNAVTVGSGNTISGLNIGNTSGTGIVGTGFGTLTISSVSIVDPVSNPRTGQALDLTTGTLAATFANLVSGSGTNGVKLTGVGGNLTINAGTLSGLSGADFLVSGGAANITYPGTITNTAGRSVDISGHTGGTILFSGAINDTGTGVFLNNNTGATINFTGGVIVDSGASPAFTATGGGTVNATQNNTTIVNTLTTTTGTALNVANTTIGASGLTFRSITSNGSGAGNGIILDTTGSNAGLTVTGNGGSCTVATPTCTGGTISNKTGADGSTTQGSGIFLNSTSGVSLTLMKLNDFQNYGIRGTSVTGFSLTNSIIIGNNGTTAAGGSEEGAVRFDGLFTSGSFPTAVITNCVLGGTTASDSSFSDDLRLTNSSGTLNRLTISNTNFGKISTGGTNGLTVVALTTASPMNLTVQDSFFTNAIGSLATITASNSTAMDVVIRRNKFSNNNVNQSSGGGGLVIQGGAGAPAVTYDVSCNTLRDSVGIALLVAKGNGSGAWTGDIINNTVGVAGVALSGSTQAAGIKVKATGTNTHTVMIRDNVVRQTNEEGIFIQNNDGSATLNASVFGNTVAEPGSFSFAGVNVDIGALGTDTSICNVVIGSAGTAADKNEVSAGDPSNFSDVNLSRIAGAGTQLNLSKNGSASVTPANVIKDDNLNSATTNTGVSGTVTLVTTLPSTPPAVAACTLPPLLFADGGIESALNSVPLLARLMGTSIHAAPCAGSESVASSLKQSQLDSIVATAVERWSATGLSDQQIGSLRSLEFEAADLLDGYLGEADANRVLVDRNAAGKGWFVDSTPQDNSEFMSRSSATRSYTNPFSAAAGHIDLLTAIEHEMGHKLGLDDSYAEKDRDNLMYGYLTVGERRLPAPSQAKNATISNTGSHFLSLKPASSKADKLVELGPSASQVFSHASKIRGAAMGTKELSSAPVLTPLAPMPALTPLSIGTLPAGKSVTIKFQVTVNNPLSPANTTQVSNQGTVSGSNFATVMTDDPAAGGAADSTVTLIARSDLTMTSKTDGVTTILPGGTLTYTLSYKNNGRSATGVVLTETVPVGTTADSAFNTPLGWTCTPDGSAGNTCTNTIGALAFDATGTKQFRVTVNTPAAAGLNTISNTASIADDGAYEPDINPGDNSKTDNDTTLNAAPDFNISKTDSDTNTSPGDHQVYTITYSNVGNQDATGVVLTETVPAGTTFTTTDSSAWTGCADGAPAGSVCTIAVGNLAGGGGNTGSPVTFAVNVINPVAAGQASIVNTASIADDLANGTDPTLPNTATDTDTLDANSDLALTKTPDITQAIPGQTITYTLNYSNIGNQGATGVVITETVPTDTTFDSAASSPTVWSCPDNSVGGTSCTTTIGSVAGGGANGTAKFAVKVIATPVGTSITNTATIDDDNANPVDPPGNDSTGSVVTSLCSNPVVTNTNNTGAGSLRQAIVDVCDGGTVTFNIPIATDLGCNSGAGPCTITLATELTISKSLTIDGPTAESVIVSGGNASRVFEITAGTVNINDLTISNGQVSAGSNGAGINNAGTLNLTGVTVSGNLAIPDATGTTGGGGIFNSGTLTLTNSTISGNHADTGAGAGNGGGIFNSATGTLTLTNCTVSGNVTDDGGQGGGINNANAGANTANLQDTIVANNTVGAGGAGPDLKGAFNSLDYNLFETTTDATFTGTTTHNITGQDPVLGPLQDNGGPTFTHALLAGSPAIDAGNSALITDQRGNQRPVDDGSITNVGNGSDIGAFEVTGAIYINEVNFHPDTTGTNEYLEFRGPAGFVMPAGTYFVVIDGDAGTTAGDVTTIIDLSNLTFGTNGYLVLLQKDNAYTTAAGATVVTSTTTGFGGLPGGIFQADGGATNLEDSGATFMLIQTTSAPSLSDDIDADDDGTPDGTVYAGWSVRDSVGHVTGGNGNDRSYGAINYITNASGTAASGTVVTIGFIVVYAGRICDSTGSTGTDWVASGTLGGAAPNWTLNSTTPGFVNPTSLAGSPLDHIGTTNFVNSAPVNTVPGAQNVNEDATLTFNAGNSNLISIADSDAGSNSVEVTLTATNGTMTLSGTTGLSFTTGDGTADATMVFTGSITDINTALDGLTFTPTSNFAGAASVQIQTNDQGNTGGAACSTAQTATDTVNIAVNAQNDNPTITTNAALTVVPGGTSTIDNTKLLVSDVDNTPAQLTFTIGTAPTHGILKNGVNPLAGGSMFTQADINSNAITFTHNGDAATTDSFTFTVSDGAGGTIGTTTFNININCSASSIVTNTNDTGTGSLREAIALACPGNTITFNIPTSDPGFSGGVYTITLTSGDLTINKNLTITGLGANVLTVKRGTAAPNFRIFTINSGITVTISGLTIANGNVTSGNKGGGVLNNGTLTLNDCNLYGNSTASSGGGIYNDGPSLILNNCNVGGTAAGQPNNGQGVYHNGGSGIMPNSGTLLMRGGSIAGNTGRGISIVAAATLNGVAITDNTGGGIRVSSNFITNIINCLIANNSETSADSGGGIRNALSTVNVVNTTISGNSTSENGGGIYNFNANITLTNVTITNNRSDSDNSGGDLSGGIYASGSVLLKNTIVAGNFRGSNPGTTAADIEATVSSSSSFNLIGTGGSGGLTNGVNNNQVGVSNLSLGTLVNNGGTTKTHALLPGSPALNTGSNANLPADTFDLDGDSNTAEPLPVDQRGPGFNRVVFTTVDIGAYEVQAGTADHLVFSVQPSTTSPNTAISPAVKVEIRDAGNALTNSTASVTLAIGANPGAGTLGGTTSVAAVAGVATFSNLSINNVGNGYTLTAASSGLLGATSNAFNIVGFPSVSGTKTASGTFAKNSTVTYTVTLTNSGGVAQADNPGNEFIDVLPAGVTLVSANATSGTAVATTGTNTVTWNGGLAANGGSVTITITATIKPTNPFGATISNQGTINYDADNNGTNESTRQTDDPAVVGAANPTVFTVSGQPSISINDVQLAEGNSATTNFTFNVTLDAASASTVTVNYATADGTAIAPSDYTALPTTTLTFAPGDLTKTVTVLVNGDTTNEPDETFFVNLTAPVNATISKAQGIGTIQNDDTPVIQFSSATYTIGEGDVNTPEGYPSLTVQVNRTGDTSGAATVHYATSDLSGNNECDVANTGNASQRCDYLMLSGTLRFAAGDGSKTFHIPIVNDGYVEGAEQFTIRLTNVTGTAAILGPADVTTVTITDNVTPATDSAHNPYLSNEFFVRMHYVDFLEREPDGPGFADWTSVLNGCGSQHGFLGAPASCDRAHISKGFFGATEFIDRGFLVYRLYEVGLNRLPLYAEYNPDAAQLRGFAQMPAPQDIAQLQINVDNYLTELAARTEFATRYASVSGNNTTDATALIQMLESTAQVTLPASAAVVANNMPPQYGRADLINRRATNQFSVVQTVKAFVEQKVVYDREYPRGFVTMQYFAYLHRDPDTAGWNDWLDVLVNGRPSQGIAPGDYNRLIFGFIYSTEYRKRFGQP